MMNEIETRRTAPTAKRRLDKSTDTPSWFTVATDAFRTSTGMVAVLVIVIQALWRGGSVAGGFFTQDDYLMLVRAANEPMSLSHLTASHAGEFSPIGNLILWATTQTAGISWGAVTVVVVLLQAAVALLTWVVLTQVLEDRWVKIPLLAVACFTPLTLGNTLWWGLATTYLPAMLLLLVGVSALLAHLREGWDRGIGVAMVALPAVLLTSDRALLLPLVAFIAVAAMLRPDELGIGARLAGTITRYAKVWLLLIVAIVARVLIGAGRENSGFGWPDTFAEARSVFEQYGRQGITGLVGGPWVGEMSGTVLVPEQTWPLAVAALLCVVLAVPVIRSLRHPVVAVSAIGLVVYFILGAGVLVLTQEGLGALGMVSRFVGDVAVPVVLCLALALRKTTAPTELQRVITRAPAVVALALAVAVVVSAGITTRAVMPTLKNEDDRAFVDYIRSGLEFEPRIVLLDTPVPEGIMSAWFGETAKVSTVAGMLPQRPTFGMPSEFLRMVDGAGILREVQIGYAVASEPAPPGECGYAVTSVRSTIPLSEAVAQGDNVVEFAYLTNGDSHVLLEAGDASVRVPVRSGVHRMQVPINAGFDEVHLTLEKVGQTLCISQLSAGVPQPAPLPPGP